MAGDHSIEDLVATAEAAYRAFYGPPSADPSHDDPPLEGPVFEAFMTAHGAVESFAPTSAADLLAKLRYLHSYGALLDGEPAWDLLEGDLLTVVRQETLLTG